MSSPWHSLVATSVGFTGCHSATGRGPPSGVLRTGNSDKEPCEEEFQKITTSENSSQMSPGLLGADPGLTRPVEIYSSRRETP